MPEIERTGPERSHKQKVRRETGGEGAQGI